jgi:hypothetical protein
MTRVRRVEGALGKSARPCVAIELGIAKMRGVAS